MTTEREFQEGQDRIRRAQGKREYLRSRSGGGRFRSSTGTTSYPRAKRHNPSQLVLWLVSIIVGIAVLSSVVPYLRDWDEGDRPTGTVERLR